MSDTATNATFTAMWAGIEKILTGYFRDVDGVIQQLAPFLAQRAGVQRTSDYKPDSRLSWTKNGLRGFLSKLWHGNHADNPSWSRPGDGKVETYAASSRLATRMADRIVETMVAGDAVDLLEEAASDDPVMARITLAMRGKLAQIQQRMYADLHSHILNHHFRNAIANPARRNPGFGRDAQDADDDGRRAGPYGLRASPDDFDTLRPSMARPVEAPPTSPHIFEPVARRKASGEGTPFSNLKSAANAGVKGAAVRRSSRPEPVRDAPAPEKVATPPAPASPARPAAMAAEKPRESPKPAAGKPTVAKPASPATTSLQPGDELPRRIPSLDMIGRDELRPFYNWNSHLGRFELKPDHEGGRIPGGKPDDEGTPKAGTDAETKEAPKAAPAAKQSSLPKDYDDFA